ncbi:cold-responsive protein kinase 1 [Lactuca sativa]|uniref:Protein kinase domain-containing protein n=1 Tax=Lactuca sativa TaxID=4236 RepID=A0A9R1UZW0_LACSA|nr:cold-responsive protein kinase 1 [Lactuca sativa]XP_023765115.1 cold-responsive protein kinase 1 [Lactuca sativa]XP_023765120.1 cold-responsive protein kinase 1 [Lactuca sativa]XP_042752207.1 cold-responsive protein kinase 1 [Lactuca sativa]XP_052621361.1 cold-responsive protein kinase 1 [Lactuca sativa]XP_052621362.1 cold-responsive protein kinase 1 [Lactuca sativa]XP_052621363.1 cold-responsive protein kinase 1 [Lactuca sativa]XP_052621364.1 cold-responsive protein kinase 1 [Lactuca sat
MDKFSCCFWKAAPPKNGVHANNGGSNIDLSVELLDVENMRLYKYKDLQIATGDFKPENKIGQGGFGSVYKGLLKDGKIVAIKVLSAESRQGLREFLTEITIISDIQHENLVKLHGYCVEKDHRILVYGYLKNSSLDQTLLGGNHCSIKFTWEIRRKICIGVAKGLTYLHEEVQPHVIHRDIKASNILLDEDFTPKISDFGLAKLFPSHLTHVSTRIAGTQGYLAPEYAIRGQLTRKADIYSFGILLLEIVTGRPNQNKRLPVEEQYLLERVWELYREGELERLVDTSMEDNDEDYDKDEACRYLKIGLLCTQSLPKNRPSMSSVMMMLNDEMDLDEKDLSDPGLISELKNFKSNKTTNTSGNNTSSSNSGKQEDKDSSLYGHSTSSFATMSFTTINDR